jgi:uncharacterized protein YukE
MENLSLQLNQTYQTFTSMETYVDMSESEKKHVKNLISAIKRRKALLFFNRVKSNRYSLEIIELKRRLLNIEKMIKNFHETANSSATKLKNIYSREVQKRWNGELVETFVNTIDRKTAKTHEERQVVHLFNDLKNTKKLKPFEDLIIMQTILNLIEKIQK